LRSAPAIDLDGDGAGEAEGARLLHAHFDLLHSLVLEADRRNALGQGFDQAEARGLGLGQHLFLERAVVDRVLDPVALPGGRQIDREHERDEHVLALAPLPLLDADHAAADEVTDDDPVHQGHSPLFAA
jgi:hypothetical protein